MSLFSFLKPNPVKPVLAREKPARPQTPKPPPAELMMISHNGQNYPVQIRRSARAKRMTLRIKAAEGIVTLTVPQRLAMSQAQAFLEAHLGWIETRFQKLPEKTAFIDGNDIPLRGVPHRLRHNPKSFGPIIITENHELIVPCPARSFEKRIREFLIAEARKDLTRAAEFYAKQLNVSIENISLKDTKSRWGSCSSRGNLSFSWRLIMAPPFVLEYLAAHEITHRREMNHSDRYWKLLYGLYPETDKAEAWLKKHGRSLHFYG